MSAAKETLTPLTEVQRAHFQWLDQPYLTKVVTALEAAEPNSARFVGGCVRDSLLGETPKDFDIATVLEPQAVIAALKKAGLAAAPTGLDHGTVTAIADHRGVEVTTLRADVSTDGRRAVVAFTRDWAVDASRRDFRINAVYLTPKGELYDPVDGIVDAKEKRVRFIGDAAERIREDFLRILRFFRFTARFSESFDQEGLAACKALKDGIGNLSAERIGAEFMAILSLPRAAFALEEMQKIGALSMVWKGKADIASVARLKRMAPESSGPLTLAVLYEVEGQGIGTRLRLSNAEKAVRINSLDAAAELDGKADDAKIRELIYRRGKDVIEDAAAAAFAFERIDEKGYQRIRAINDQWTVPVFPISGKDVLAAGVAAGPAVSAILAQVESQWIAEGFPGAARVEMLLKDAVAQRPA